MTWNRCVCGEPHDDLPDIGYRWPDYYFSIPEVERDSYETYKDNYDSVDIAPFFGWFSNSLSFYDEDSFALRAKAHSQGSDQRPLVELESVDQPLVRGLKVGVSLEQAWKYVHWGDGAGTTWQRVHERRHLAVRRQSPGSLHPIRYLIIHQGNSDLVVHIRH